MAAVLCREASEEALRGCESRDVWLMVEFHMARLFGLVWSGCEEGRMEERVLAPLRVTDEISSPNVVSLAFIYKNERTCLMYNLDVIYNITYVK